MKNGPFTVIVFDDINNENPNDALEEIFVEYNDAKRYALSFDENYACVIYDNNNKAIG